MTRRVFYSFHYKPDVTRVSQVRNIGALEANKPAKDNDWETVTAGKDSAIKKWIADQMKRRSCTVVLVGENTANRKWINHEIIESWNSGMGVVGIYIHGLKNLPGDTSKQGENPFDSMKLSTGAKLEELSNTVKCYNPKGNNSKERYDWISKNLENVVEEAIEIRKVNNNRYCNLSKKGEVVMSRSILMFFVLVVLVFSAGCATKRYGRLQPVTGSEQSTYSCEDIKMELSKIDTFELQVAEGAEFSALSIASFLGDFGIGNIIERDAAIKTAKARRVSLNGLAALKKCP